MTFEKVLEKLKAEDTTGIFAKAEELSLVSVKAIEYAFNSGYSEGLKAKRQQNDIRWTDKLSIKCNGDIVDFEGRIVGHINLKDVKDKITADETITLVDKIDQVIKKDGYFVGVAYNDKSGMAHLIIDKGSGGDIYGSN